MSCLPGSSGAEVIDLKAVQQSDGKDVLINIDSTCAIKISFNKDSKQISTIVRTKRLKGDASERSICPGLKKTTSFRTESCAPSEDESTPPCARRAAEEESPCSKASSRLASPCAAEQEPPPCARAKETPCSKASSRRTSPSPCARRAAEQESPCSKASSRLTSPCALEQEPSPCARRAAEEESPCSKASSRAAEQEPPPCARAKEAPCSKASSRATLPCAAAETPCSRAASQREKETPCSMRSKASATSIGSRSQGGVSRGRHANCFGDSAPSSATNLRKKASGTSHRSQAEEESPCMQKAQSKRAPCDCPGKCECGASKGSKRSAAAGSRRMGASSSKTGENPGVNRGRHANCFASADTGAVSKKNKGSKTSLRGRSRSRSRSRTPCGGKSPARRGGAGVKSPPCSSCAGSRGVKSPPPLAQRPKTPLTRAPCVKRPRPARGGGGAAGGGRGHRPAPCDVNERCRAAAEQQYSEEMTDVIAACLEDRSNLKLDDADRKRPPSISVGPDEELWLFQCPKRIPIKRLVGARLRLDLHKDTAVTARTIDGEDNVSLAASTRPYSTERELSIAGASDRLQRLRAVGTIRLKEKLPEVFLDCVSCDTCNAEKIPLPDGLKTRHPLHGADYEDKIKPVEGKKRSTGGGFLSCFSTKEKEKSQPTSKRASATSETGSKRSKKSQESVKAAADDNEDLKWIKEL